MQLRGGRRETLCLCVIFIILSASYVYGDSSPTTEAWWLRAAEWIDQTIFQRALTQSLATQLSAITSDNTADDTMSKEAEAPKGKTVNPFKQGSEELLEISTEITPYQYVVETQYPFEFKYYQFDVPAKDINTTYYLVTHMTRYCGSFVLSSLLTDSTTHYSSSVKSSLGGLTQLITSSEMNGTVLMAVEGNGGYLWNELTETSDPTTSYWSLITTVYDQNFKPLSLMTLNNGVSQFTEAKNAFQASFVYNRTNVEDPIFISLNCLQGLVRLYLSFTPNPSLNNHVLDLIVGGGDAVRAVEMTDSAEPTVYITMTPHSVSLSHQVLTLVEGYADFVILEGVHTYKKRAQNNDGSYYKLMLPGTSSYKWMEITFAAYKGLSVIVKHGARPTLTDYDWIWEAPADFPNGINWESMYIPATDPNFNVGEIYIWLHATRHLSIDSFIVKLAKWYPRLV